MLHANAAWWLWSDTAVRLSPRGRLRHHSVVTAWCNPSLSFFGKRRRAQAMFYCLFHVWLNVLAELLRFGDRVFYRDW